MGKRKYKGIQTCIYLDKESTVIVSNIKKKMGEDWTLSNFVREQLKLLHNDYSHT